MIPHRKLNIKVLLLLIGGSVATCVAVYFLHQFQVRRTASHLLVMAERKEKAGEIDKAVTALELYVNFRPEDNDGLARLAHLRDKRATTPGAKFRAALLLEKVAIVDPSREADLRRAAEIFTELGNYREFSGFKLAKPYWEMLLKKYPNDGVIEGKLALGEEGLARYNESDALYASAIRHSPKEIDLYVQYASLLKDKRRLTQRASAIMDAMVAANRENPRAFTERARFRIVQALPGAEEDLDRVRDLDPKSIDLALLSSQVALGANQAPKAIDILKAAVKEHPTELKLFMALGIAQTSNNRVDDAVATLRQGIEVDPKSIDLRFVLADTLLQFDRVAEAKPEIDEIVAKNPDSPPTNYLLARVLLGEKKWADAARKLEVVAGTLGPWPDMARMAYFYAGTAYERLASPDQALVAYNQALAISPDWVSGKIRVGATLVALGRFEDALRIYRSMPISTPGVRSSIIRIRMIQNNRLPAAQRTWDDVDRLLTDGERGEGQTPEIKALKIDLLLAKGKVAEARALVEKARGESPDQVALSISLAGLLQAEGKADEALAVIDQAQTKFGDTVQIRLARIRYWLVKGGQQAPTALAALRDDLNKFSKAEQSDILNALATASLQMGNRSESGQLLEESIERDPDSLRLRVRQLEMALESGRKESVRPVIDQLRRIEGEDGVFWRLGEVTLLVDAARKEKSTTGLKEARVLLQESLKKRPELPDALRLLAEVDELENKDDAAIANYQKAFDGGNRSPLALSRLARLLIQRNRFADANKLIQSIERLGTLSSEMKKLAAEVALKAKDDVRAIALVKDAVPADSKSVPDLLWQGRMLLTVGETVQAEATLRKAIALDLKLAAPRVALVQLLTATGAKDKAAAEAVEAEKLIPPTSTTELAELAVATGRADLARVRFDKAVVEKPNDLLTLRQASTFFLNTSQPNLAIPLLRKIIDPALNAPEAERVLARRNLSLLLSTSRRPKVVEEAEALVDENLQDHPDAVDDLRIKARIIAVEPGRGKDAIQAYERLRTLQALTPSESFILAQLLETDGQWPAARQIALAVLGATPPPLNVAVWYTTNLLKRNETAEAAVWLGKIEAADPRSNDAPLLRGRWLAAMKQGDQAATLLEARAKANPGSAVAISGVLEQIGQPEAARRVIQGLIDQGRLVDAPLLMAGLLARQGRINEAIDITDKAWATSEPQQVALVCSSILDTPAGRSNPTARARVIKALQAAIDKNPKVTVLYITLSMLLLTEKQPKEAEALYRRVMEMYPSETSIYNNLAWMLCFLDGRGSEAVTLIDKAISIEGPEPHYLDTRGLAQLGAGNYEQAVSDFERSIAAKPNDLPTVYFHLARAQVTMKNITAASASLRKAESLGFKVDSLHPIEVPSYRDLRAALGATK